MSGTRIRIRIDPAPFRRFTSELVRKQYPFATALTLTRLAYMAADAERVDVEKVVDPRGNFVRRGIRAVKATKRRQWAEVGWRPPGGHRPDDPMVALGEGGRLDGPVATPEMRARTKTGRTTPAHWPGRVLEKSARASARRKRPKKAGKHRKPLPFKTRLKSGKEVIAVRDGSERVPFTVLYSFDKSTTFRRKWMFRRNARRTVEKNFHAVSRSALAQALRTAARKA